MEATTEQVQGQEHSQPQMVHWRIFIFSAILALTGLFCTSQPNAEIYKWVDEKGVIHYGNRLPADSGNVKIVSREYRHDEAAGQKRVKADQKKIDAVTEKIKKGEQQASVEEQKKSEEAKQTQPPSQEERIESEKQRLQEKISELEAQPLDYFGSQKNKRTRVGYYKYRLETLLQDPNKYFSEPEKYEGNISNSRTEDTKADASCYLKASVDVRVIVWHADRSGNKGVEIWEGVLKKGETKLINTPDGNIRYAHRINLADDQYFSGDKNRYCENGQEISVP